MKLFMPGMALACFAMVANPVPAQPGSEKPTPKVGQVFIIGNDITQDRVIRDLVGLMPGQTLRYPELRLAEMNLAKSKLFSLKKDEMPEVKVLNPDSDDEFKDIMVRVRETSTSSMYFDVGFNRKGVPVVRFVREERNFDLSRWPTSWEDITEGRAFRGAGMKHRLALIEIDILTHRVAFFAPIGL